jgi:hypothetical protein
LKWRAGLGSVGTTVAPHSTNIFFARYQPRLTGLLVL